MNKLKRSGAVSGFTAFCLIAASAAGEPEANTDFPAMVIKTEPENRATGVDFTIQEIKVTYDRSMDQGSWSWIIHTNLGLYPGYRGSANPRWEDKGKTCVLPVKLSPDTVYAIGVNSFRHTGFKDETGKTAVPHVWVFKTKKTK
ncbi:MAG: Ig-like domain-containing protein [Planctomycetota bacterium]|nr:Ig-like domain-containing protein [Planctomycetota bacterium]MDP7399122.1 Ig-like domain-containing protein [Lentisphaeria bacterium]